MENNHPMFSHNSSTGIVPSSSPYPSMMLSSSYSNSRYLDGFVGFNKREDIRNLPAVVAHEAKETPYNYTATMMSNTTTENPLAMANDQKITSSSVGNSTAGKNKGERKTRNPRFAFKTRSQVDILDDGYRWRKYGQKAVKNNKFPRSYYRCTHQGCNVKKQVQRLTRDEDIVVTTYEGKHTHTIEKTTDNFEQILNQMQIYPPTHS